MRKNSASDDQFAIPIYWWLMAHSLCTRRLRGSTGVERSSSASAARENNQSVDVESIHLALLPFFLDVCIPCCCQASSHPSWQQVIVLTFSSASISIDAVATREPSYTYIYATPQEKYITFKEKCYHRIHQSCILFSQQRWILYNRGWNIQRPMWI